jgi:hypothetical protein
MPQALGGLRDLAANRRTKMAAGVENRFGVASRSSRVQRLSAKICPIATALPSPKPAVSRMGRLARR